MDLPAFNAALALVASWSWGQAVSRNESWWRVRAAVLRVMCILRTFVAGQRDHADACVGNTRQHSDERNAAGRETAPSGFIGKGT